MHNQRLELTWFNKNMALIPKDQENAKYDYEWVDPQDPRYCETHTLVMDEYIKGEQAEKEDRKQYSALADLEPTTDNLMILGESGDALEALVRIPELRAKYAGQVKLVYIDPPFNTGDRFTNYDDNLEHSVWLTMMRDRLVHLRDLLASNGSIWVHLDDSENHRMRSLLDEVFGAGNFVAQIAWEKVAGRDNRSLVSKTCDTITVYAKRKDEFKEARNLIPRSAKQISDSYTNPDNDPRGPWTSGDFTAQYNPAENPRLNQRYTLVTPSGKKYEPPAGRCWLYKEPDYYQLIAEDRLWFGEDGQNIPRLKRFLSEVQDGLVPKTLWPHKEVGTNDLAKKQLQKLFPNARAFDTPKPEVLLERIIHIATQPGEIVLDCFAGSGTTGAVAQKMGRRWVVCELKEENFVQFTKPRLTKVVNNEDEFGITYTKDRLFKDTAVVPDDYSADEVEDSAKLLRAIVKMDEISADQREAIKEVQKLIATKPSTVRNWRGGGGFQVAHLSPACFSYDSDLEAVTLTEAATGETLKNAVAAHLGFTLTPEDPFFDGVLGAQRLVVLETFATAEDVDELVSHLDEGETLVLCATGLDTGIRKHLLKTRRGSVAKHIPDDLFTVSARMKDIPSVDPDEVSVKETQEVK